ncbi:heat shock protein 70 (HSP70)-interacting protein [Achlya hypogyna]|uniref:Heat shock protein 70 (HSP70)-interacting protein n=1 Tax=Achlya hypogyna TaxID=1202772 RepID=A0A1V9ZAI8_ACHHY|nr:heat shock protein 70 (HSP70)-interacting protein [Achlya hypogyna]
MSSVELKEQGNHAFEDKRYGEAEALYAKAILQDPHQHALYGNRSAARFHLQKYEDALQDAEVAIALDPKWAKGYFRQGHALEALGRFRRAQLAYEQAAKIGNNKREVLQKAAAVKKLADKIDREKKICGRDDWKEVYSHISETKMRLGLLVLFWNESTKPERFAFFMRFLEILAGNTTPTRISKYSSNDMDEIPAVNYAELTIPRTWAAYFAGLDLAKKAERTRQRLDMYTLATPAEQTTIVNDMKYYVHELCGARELPDE